MSFAVVAIAWRRDGICITIARYDGWCLCFSLQDALVAQYSSTNACRRGSDGLGGNSSEEESEGKLPRLYRIMEIDAVWAR